MSRIWILGDSWGTLEGMHKSISSTQMHLHQYLEQAGHTVTNFSVPGASNGESISRAIDAIDSTPSPDYMIWFHTESLRERIHGLLDRPYGIMELTRQQALQNYLYWKKLIDRTQARDIIIGGQAPVIVDLLQHQPYHVIEDWRCELLRIPSIMTHSVCHRDLFEHPNCRDDYKIRMDMLAQNEMIVDMARDSKLFPDNAHPGTVAHKALFKRIQPLIHK